jgi:hypothetical protein
MFRLIIWLHAGNKNLQDKKTIILVCVASAGEMRIFSR